MSVVGLSPSDAKLLITAYKTYREARDAAERFARADTYCLAAKATLQQLRVSHKCSSTVFSPESVVPWVVELQDAITDLDTYLNHYRTYLSASTRVQGWKNLVRRLQWALSELDGKVTALQNTVVAASNLALLSLAVQTQ